MQRRNSFEYCSVAQIFVPLATTRAGTARLAIPTIALNTYGGIRTRFGDSFYSYSLMSKVRTPFRQRLWSASMNTASNLMNDAPAQCNYGSVTEMVESESLFNVPAIELVFI